MNLRARIFGRLGLLAFDHPALLLAAGIALALASLAYASGHLRLETSRSALISPHRPYNRLYRRYRDEFEKSDDIIIAATGPDQDEIEDFITDVAASLERDTERVRSISARIETSALDSKKLLYLTRPEIETLRSRLAEHHDLIADVSARPGLNRLFEAINTEMSAAMVSHALSSLFGEPTPGKNVAPFDLSVLESLLLELERATRGRTFHSPWKALVEPGTSSFLRSKNGRFYFVLIQPQKRAGDFDFAAGVLATIRSDVALARARHPSVDAGVTGMFALATDEMSASRRDMTISTFIAIGGVLLLFILMFRELRGPLYAGIALLLSMAWTLGFAALSIGYLTVLSIAFTAIVIGLGIDFGIHLLCRFQEERAGGVSDEVALSRALIGAGPGMTAGAVTTALAFYAVTLTGFRGLAQVGAIAGTGVLLALLSALTMFPALISLSSPARRPPTVPRSTARALAWLDGQAYGVLAAVALFTLATAALLPRLSFDDNLLELQAHGTESVDWERRIMAGSQRSTWYAVSIAPTLEETRRRAEAFATLPAVERVESIASLLPSHQEERREALRAIRPLVGDLSLRPRRPAPIDLDALTATLQSIRFKLSEAASARWSPGRRPDQEQLDRTRALLARILPALPASDTIPKLSAFEVRLFDDFYHQLGTLTAGLDPGPVTLADLPPSITGRFIGRHGRYLLQIYARSDIWQHDNMAELLGELRAVDPTVTGAPVQTFEAANAMRAGYERGGLYALVVILVVLALELRTLLGIALSFAPLLVGGIWALGLMSGFGVELNLANSIMLPLLIGIGVDSGIHLTKRYLEDRRAGFSLLATSTAWAVAASGLTTMIGFGSLLVARHRGIFSIGLVLVLGVGCVLVASFLLVPALLAIRSGRPRSDA